MIFSMAEEKKKLMLLGGLPSATRENLPNATRMADTVICLPIHHELTPADQQRVLDVVVK